MSATFPQHASAFKPLSQHAGPTLLPHTSRLFFRGALLLTCAAAVTVAAWVGDAGPYQRADPSLARLLQGMALIKAAIALGAVALLLWRFGWPVGKPAALAYGMAAALMAGATMLIWQLSFIPLAAAFFHIGALVMLLVGWQDEGYRGQARAN
jgi:hypothetical protein